MQRITDDQKYENLNMAKNKIIFSQIRDFQSTNIIAKIRGYFFRLRRMKENRRVVARASKRCNTFF